MRSDPPATWTTESLGTLSENHDKRRIPLSGTTREGRRGGYPYWGANGILDHVDGFIFDGPHVLLAEDGTVERDDGRAVVHFVNGQFWVNNHAHVLAAADDVDLRWLYYALLDVRIRPFLTGSVQLKLTQRNLRQIPIATPPSDEQRRISWVLGALDDKIKNNRRIAKTLEEIASTLFKARFVDFVDHDDLVESEIGPIPKGWSPASIADLCSEARNGGTPRRMESSYWEGGAINWFRTGELCDGFLPPESELKITQRGLDESACRLFPPRTILIAIYAAPTVGRLGILDSESACNQACTALQARDEIGYPFLYFSLKYLRGYFNSVSSGSAQQNISKKVITDARIVRPPDSGLLAFDRQARPLLEMGRVAQQQAETLVRIRDALLPRLVSGQIRVPAGAVPEVEAA